MLATIETAALLRETWAGSQTFHPTSRIVPDKTAKRAFRAH
jgi:hypothetical protein